MTSIIPHAAAAVSILDSKNELNFGLYLYLSKNILPEFPG